MSKQIDVSSFVLSGTVSEENFDGAVVYIFLKISANFNSKAIVCTKMDCMHSHCNLSIDNIYNECNT